VFEQPLDIVKCIEDEVDREWHSDYSRHLLLDIRQKKEAFLFTDHLDNKVKQRATMLAVTNNRFDIVAYNCVFHICQILDEHGIPIKYKDDQKVDNSPLKVSGLMGYSCTIWPRQTVEFSFLVLREDSGDVVLQSMSDVKGKDGKRQALLSKPGQYYICCEIAAERFPIFRFKVPVSLIPDASNPGKISNISLKNITPEEESICDNSLLDTSKLPRGEVRKPLLDKKHKLFL